MIKFISRFFKGLLLFPWRLLKLALGYGFLYCLAFLLSSMMSETATFTKRVQASSEAERAYILCVFVMRTLEPHATEFNSCLPYKMDRALASEDSHIDPINAECPAGKKMKMYFGKPVCLE